MSGKHPTHQELCDKVEGLSKILGKMGPELTRSVSLLPQLWATVQSMKPELKGIQGRMLKYRSIDHYDAQLSALAQQNRVLEARVADLERLAGTFETNQTATKAQIKKERKAANRRIRKIEQGRIGNG